MSKKNYEALKEKVKSTSKDVLRQVVNSVDGHTIYAPKKFTDLGLDPEIVEAYTRVHESGNHPKEMISAGNTVLPSLQGVYSLNLLQFIAGAYGVDSNKLGRGSRATDLAEQLCKLWE